MADYDIYTWTQTNGDVYHFRDDRSVTASYGSPSDLGLSDVNARVEDIVDALPDGSIFIGSSANFDPDYLPTGFVGIIEVVKRADGKVYIEAFGDTEAHGDWRMYLFDGDPSGTWDKMLRDSDFLVEEVTIEDNVTVTAGTFMQTDKNVGKTGYKVVGLVGARSAQATVDGVNSSLCCIWSMHVSVNRAYISVRNFGVSDAKIRTVANVLYMKI